MEITLEKIELVKDRTGVSYREAKEALEEANGSVVDDIINIEESMDYINAHEEDEESKEGILKRSPPRPNRAWIMPCFPFFSKVSPLSAISLECIPLTLLLSFAFIIAGFF